MYLSIKELYKSDILEFPINLDLSDFQINDVLIKKIKQVRGNLKVTLSGDDTVLLSFVLNYDVDYLDARTLEKLDLNFDLDDDIMLTSDVKKAEELDIDYVDDEIDIKQLIGELILVNIPFNYSVAQKSSSYHKEDDNTYHPFKDL